VFTGDNAKLTAFLTDQARERDSLFNTDYKKRRSTISDPNDAKTGPFSPTKRKEDLNAEADQET
jgi:hypothetical protein